MITPHLPLTVDRDFWNEMAQTCGGPFADSYLSGAELHQGRLLPRTHIAWERLGESFAAKAVLRKTGTKLVEPPYFDAHS